ncbi:hypothetical protein LXL04_004326 [Taraxacum kok-saghyz]
MSKLGLCTSDSSIFGLVFNEYALKSQYNTSIYLQNLILYGYGAIFNFLGILGTVVLKGLKALIFCEAIQRLLCF